ncbi:uncharacterized protein LOC116303917 [Actinia tenebrosa]|uniref:Uncharacterized protein LOC116303917 n=1 Tax=Actinia tenebrosa TaxID=6105 RepID=A0A6P8ISY7_ACTTE|nr:uncharacterized protein LOC116303917 [Actinia tenebrosa]
MKLLFLLLGSLAVLVTSSQPDDQNDVIRLIKVWGLNEHHGHRDKGPFKECVKGFKECVSSGIGGLADEQSCRMGFCDCRKNVCQAYFKSCGSNSWCSFNDICFKSSAACRSEPKKESKCRRSLMKCLKRSSMDKTRTYECMKMFNDCLS